MERQIIIGEHKFSLDLLDGGKNGDLRFVRVDDGTAPQEGGASVLEVMPGVWSVLIGGRSFEARVISDDGAVVIEINGERYPVMVEDPRRKKVQPAAASREGRTSISAPMPGKIVRVLVAQGDLVGQGQGVIVIEAMKMQNELKAPWPGHVVSLPVREGETVAAGAVVAVIE